VGGRSLENEVVIILKGSAAGARDLTSGKPSANEPQGDTNEDEPNQETNATAF
jgi:hypothetical protein